MDCLLWKEASLTSESVAKQQSLQRIVGAAQGGVRQKPLLITLQVKSLIFKVVEHS